MPLWHVRAQLYVQTSFWFWCSLHNYVCYTLYKVNVWVQASWECFDQTGTGSQQKMSLHWSWINNSRRKIVACHKFQANVSELGELKNVKANWVCYIDKALNLNWMGNCLIRRPLMSGVSATQSVMLKMLNIRYRWWPCNGLVMSCHFSTLLYVTLGI